MKIEIARMVVLLAVFIGVQGNAQSPQEMSNAEKVVKGLGMSAPTRPVLSSFST